jgi:hypothetical protein
MPDSPVTAAEYREAQGAEYGTYVANQAIEIGGARAFNKGDAVPVSHVERKVVPLDQVSKITTRAGREAAGVAPATADPKG